MLKLLALFNLSIFVGNKNPQCHLKNDLIKDRLILTTEHNDYNLKVLKSLKIFDAYAKLSLADYKFEKYVKGKHIISKWTKAIDPSIFIYEVVSEVAADTVYREKTINWDSVAKKNVVLVGKSIKLKAAKYMFHTYIIKPASGKQLIYMTGSIEGLQKYYIGNKAFYPIYEAELVGINFPNLNEILKLTVNSKLQ